MEFGLWRRIILLIYAAGVQKEIEDVHNAESVIVIMRYHGVESDNDFLERVAYFAEGILLLSKLFGIA